MAVLDVDFHHGNGTQAIFYDRADVMFLSLHGDPMDAFVLEISAVVDAVNSGQPAQFLMGDLARDAIVICQKQTESVRTGHRVEL